MPEESLAGLLRNLGFDGANFVVRGDPGDSWYGVAEDLERQIIRDNGNVHEPLTYRLENDDSGGQTETITPFYVTADGTRIELIDAAYDPDNRRFNVLTHVQSGRERVFVEYHTVAELRELMQLPLD